MGLRIHEVSGVVLTGMAERLTCIAKYRDEQHPRGFTLRELKRLDASDVQQGQGDPEDCEREETDE